MNQTPTAPPVTLEEVYALEQFAAVVPDEPNLPRTDADISYRWEWRFVERAQIQVRFGVRVGPAAARPEFLQVLMGGSFQIREPMGLEAVASFAAINAPATLVPYIREALATLSMRGPFHPFRLPLLNVVDLSRSFEKQDAEGWRQAIADPSLLTPDAAAAGG